ncbi:hypothetical protein CLOP_g11395 [Closterium sp. NIES-67]|nr:hypothetical protein CLOP_g11395 [Closterium sp. NIES-67]
MDQFAPVTRLSIAVFLAVVAAATWHLLDNFLVITPPEGCAGPAGSPRVAECLAEFRSARRSLGVMPQAQQDVTAAMLVRVELQARQMMRLVRQLQASDLSGFSPRQQHFIRAVSDDCLEQGADAAEEVREAYLELRAGSRGDDLRFQLAAIKTKLSNCVTGFSEFAPAALKTALGATLTVGSTRVKSTVSAAVTIASAYSGYSNKRQQVPQAAGMRSGQGKAGSRPPAQYPPQQAGPRAGLRPLQAGQTGQSGHGELRTTQAGPAGQAGKGGKLGQAGQAGQAGQYLPVQYRTEVPQQSPVQSQNRYQIQAQSQQLVHSQVQPDYDYDGYYDDPIDGDDDGSTSGDRREGFYRIKSEDLRPGLAQAQSLDETDYQPLDAVESTQDVERGNDGSAGELAKAGENAGDWYPAEPSSFVSSSSVSYSSDGNSTPTGTAAADSEIPGDINYDYISGNDSSSDYDYYSDGNSASPGVNSELDGFNGVQQEDSRLQQGRTTDSQQDKSPSDSSRSQDNGGSAGDAVDYSVSDVLNIDADSYYGSHDGSRSGDDGDGGTDGYSNGDGGIDIDGKASAASAYITDYHSNDPASGSKNGDSGSDYYDRSDNGGNVSDESDSDGNSNGPSTDIGPSEGTGLDYEDTDNSDTSVSVASAVSAASAVSDASAASAASGVSSNGGSDDYSTDGSVVSAASAESATSGVSGNSGSDDYSTEGSGVSAVGDNSGMSNDNTDAASGKIDDGRLGYELTDAEANDDAATNARDDSGSDYNADDTASNGVNSSGSDYANSNGSDDNGTADYATDPPNKGVDNSGYEQGQMPSLGANPSQSDSRPSQESQVSSQVEYGYDYGSQGAEGESSQNAPGVAERVTRNRQLRAAAAPASVTRHVSHESPRRITAAATRQASLESLGEGESGYHNSVGESGEEAGGYQHPEWLEAGLYEQLKELQARMRGEHARAQHWADRRRKLLGLPLDAETGEEGGGEEGEMGGTERRRRGFGVGQWQRRQRKSDMWQRRGALQPRGLQVRAFQRKALQTKGLQRKHYSPHSAYPPPIPALRPKPRVLVPLATTLGQKTAPHPPTAGHHAPGSLHHAPGTGPSHKEKQPSHWGEAGNGGNGGNGGIGGNGDAEGGVGGHHKHLWSNGRKGAHHPKGVGHHKWKRKGGSGGGGSNSGGSGISRGSLKADAVVGPGEKYNTVEGALSAAPKDGRFVIFIRAGTYRESIIFRNKGLIMVGEGSDRTIITGSKSAGSGSTTYRSATIGANKERFCALGIRFENTAGPENHQAVAMRASGDRSAFFECAFEANQDTLYVDAGRQYYKDCYIGGTIDFIFGDAAVVIDNPTIVVHKSSSFSTITASGRESETPTGIVIRNAKISTDSGAMDVYLGRPWKNCARTVFVNCYMPAELERDGWSTWGGDTKGSCLYYAEKGSTGPGYSASRASWVHPGIISDASQFDPEPFVDLSSWLDVSGKNPKW